MGKLKADIPPEFSRVPNSRPVSPVCNWRMLVPDAASTDATPTDPSTLGETRWMEIADHGTQIELSYVYLDAAAPANGPTVHVFGRDAKSNYQYLGKSTVIAANATDVTDGTNQRSNSVILDGRGCVDIALMVTVVAAEAGTIEAKVV